MIGRREFLAAAAAAQLRGQDASGAGNASGVQLGIDLFSLRSQAWTPFQYLDYCARLGARVVHFSEIRFLGGLDPRNLGAVRARAEELGIRLEIGMRSICPSSSLFDASQGAAEQQLARMLEAARLAGSSIVRAVLGSSADRNPPGIAARIEETVRVLRAARSRALDSGVRIAIENHAGDMQARELKTLIEEAGADFTGACLDSGNPLWTLEDPHLALEILHPYVLTSHVRDSAVWAVPEGAAVAWVRMGEGNVGIADYVRRYAALCPGRALSLEIIVTQPRVFKYRDPRFWDAYRGAPAWEFQRFLNLVDHGKPRAAQPPVPPSLAAARERQDLEASLQFTKDILKS